MKTTKENYGDTTAIAIINFVILGSCVTAILYFALPIIYTKLLKWIF